MPILFLEEAFLRPRLSNRRFQLPLESPVTSIAFVLLSSVVECCFFLSAPKPSRTCLSEGREYLLEPITQSLFILTHFVPLPFSPCSMVSLAVRECSEKCPTRFDVSPGQQGKLAGVTCRYKKYQHTSRTSRRSRWTPASRWTEWTQSHHLIREEKCYREDASRGQG